MELALDTLWIGYLSPMNLIPCPVLVMCSITAYAPCLSSHYSSPTVALRHPPDWQQFNDGLKDVAELLQVLSRSSAETLHYHIGGVRTFSL